MLCYGKYDGDNDDRHMDGLVQDCSNSIVNAHRFMDYCYCCYYAMCMVYNLEIGGLPVS